jgi:2-polyprenyl-3-methyl-5-hydroxy-6-metoxy-1,4-benzoquinol methylase
MNYEQEYNDYWSRADRWGSHSFKDPNALTDQILSICGRGSVLDVGCGMGLLVRTLAARGIDARGIDISPRPIEEANRLMPGRFQQGSILSLPFAGESFDTVVTTDCLEHLAEADVAGALNELHRVARRFVFVQLSTKPDRDGRWHLAIHDRAWWESQFFIAGFRRHLLNQLAVPYESLEQEGWQITLVFEKIPAAALAEYSLTALKTERDLHMDMLRESGRRSDAHIARYMLARQYLPREGVIVDAACGLGYGSAILAQSAPQAQVVGIDNSDFAVRYAEKNFPQNLANLTFRQGDVCDLGPFADASVDLVASFETVEHLREPRDFLKEVQRVLKPGGRFICSVPNLWVDESGKDPNPWHFHVFDFSRLANLCSEFFDLGEVYRQTAGGGMKLPNAPRELRRVNLPVNNSPDQAEWWLMAARHRKLSAPAIATDNDAGLIVALTHDPHHPLFSSWLSEAAFPVEYVTDVGLDYQFPDGTTLVVAADTYHEPRVSLLRKAVEQGIPTLILADGILEYRNTWEHPQLAPGAVFQPVLGHKIACLGRSQARILESWGNKGLCEVVGSPRFDSYAGLKRRQREPDQPFRVLVATALTPYFTPEHHERVRSSLLDLKDFFASTPAIDDMRIEPTWRVTNGLDAEVGVDSVITDLTGRPLIDVLQNVDAVITTPSTLHVEAMLLGLPVAVLDYCNCPHYVPPAWRITAPNQIAPTLAELIDPPAPKMLFQDTTLHDTLQCATPAKPRLLALASAMSAEGRQARSSGQPLRLAERIIPLEHGDQAVAEDRFQPVVLYPDHAPFQERNLSSLQVEVGHLRRYSAGLEKRLRGAGLDSNLPNHNHSALANASASEKVFDCLQHLSQVRLMRGVAQQVAAWNVPFAGESFRAIFLQPPAEIVFDVPAGATGWLVSAVMLHPDVWEKPESGGCEFHVRIDGRQAFVMAIDPTNLPSDRRWHEINIHVPESARGRHQIHFETRAIGKNDFRWALWRAPRFTWQTPASANNPEPAPALQC